MNTDPVTTDPQLDVQRPEQRRPPAPAPSGGAVYGLGFVGALVWFWRGADAPEERALAVLKAMVWPALLVYEAFRALDKR